jgi:HD-like signal output (HDOD) protein
MVDDSQPLSLESLVQRAGDLNMMPQVARKVIELVADENSTAAQLATLLEKDANITTRILKIANSAFYGLRREVKTVQQAIVILGFKSLRSMVVASSSKALHKRFGITEQLMWDHSVGTAIGGKVFAEKLSPAVGEIAFVGGLLHNVGCTVMNNECPKPFLEVMKKIYNSGVASIDAEIEIFKYAHPEVGFRVTEKWGLPPELSKIIRFYSISRLKEAERAPLYQEQMLKMALACVEVASHACRHLGIGYRDKKPEPNLLELEGAKILQLNAEKLNDILKRFDELYQKEKAVFNS